MENAPQVLAKYIRTYPDFHNNITAEHLQRLYHELRPLNELSLQQTKAAIQTVCYCELCLEEEILDVLQEMDRRSFLMKDLEWEFAMLAGSNSNLITQEQAAFLCRCYCGDEFTEKWNSFVSNRAENSLVTLSEIELILCAKKDDNVLDIDDTFN